MPTRPGGQFRSRVSEIPGRAARGEAFSIAWRGGREESAARTIRGSARAPALHRWTRSADYLAIPSYRQDRDALAALLTVERVPAELLQLYALEHWRRWPLIERAALVVAQVPPDAVRDAMARILWRVAPIAQDARARELGVRAATYRAQTRQAQAVLWGWLERAARQFLEAMQGAGGPDVRTGSDPCALARTTWWNPDAPVSAVVYRTDLHPADSMNRDGPAIAADHPARCAA